MGTLLGNENRLSIEIRKCKINATYFRKNSLAGDPLVGGLSVPLHSTVASPATTCKFGGQFLGSNVSLSKSISTVSSHSLDVLHSKLF